MNGCGGSASVSLHISLPVALVLSYFGIARARENMVYF